MQPQYLALLLVGLLLSSCTRECDSNEAYNRMLALGKVQSRLVAKGGEGGAALANLLATESVPVGELIAQGKYGEACKKADEIEAAHGLDLKGEISGMVTMEELAKDGGKGSGHCSMADASRKQMELHGLLQAEVDNGKRSSEVFRDFAKDTLSFGDLLTSDPSKACDLIEDLRKKYEL